MPLRIERRSGHVMLGTSAAAQSWVVRDLMTRELIGDYSANDRELLGRFLRYAFPLRVGSFAEILSAHKDNKRDKKTSRH